MAKKKAAVRSMAAPAGGGKTDVQLVQEAYEEAVKAQVGTFITNCISQTPDPETKFVTGLKIIRKARERATALVQ